MGLSNVALVQHDFIMTPVPDFELLKITADLLYVIGLSNHHKSENEDRVTCIDTGEAVVAALINKDEIVPKLRCRGRCWNWLG